MSLNIDKVYQDAYDAEVKRAYGQAVEEYSAQRVQAEQNEDFETIPFFQESLKLAEENARLDEQYPAYEGETIDINGVQKTVYNSNGERIAISAEALRNFYNWFGDSKVVDEQGRPKVVYHGTNARFSVFSTDFESNGKTLGDGFYFSNNTDAAEDYGKYRVDVYLSLENPLFLDEDNAYNVFENELGISKDEIEGWKNYYSNSKWHVVNRIFSEDNLTNVIKNKGYDGIICTDRTSFGRDYPINEYVAFEPEQIKSTSNRGTFSKDNPDIYYQSGVVDSVKNLFKPLVKDISQFRSIFRKTIRGEVGENTILQISERTPEVYKMLGLDDKPMGISNKTIKKANIGKHDVPLDVLEELPEYIFDPIAVLDSKTNKGSLVSILNAVDKNGDTVVAIIKPTKGKYNIIPSIYGKDDLDNLIKSSKIRYKDIERANIAIRPSSLQLLGVDNTVGSLTKSSITPSEANVKKNQQKFYQGESNPLGAYMPASRVIHLFKKVG